MEFTVKNYAEFQKAVDELCEFLSAHAVPLERIFDSRLAAHELLGNVLQHTEGSGRLRVEIVGEHLHLFVKGEKAFAPPKESVLPNGYAERGRGLYLVDSLCIERSLTPEGEIFVKIALQ